MSRLLYLLGLSLAMMLGLLFLTGHASRLRFDVSSWALAFPLDALAVATLMYAAGVPGLLTNGGWVGWVQAWARCGSAVGPVER